MKDGQIVNEDVNPSNEVYAVIFAGGMGSRMSGAKIPKQFLKQGGKTIISHTLEKYQNHNEISGIIVVCVEDWIPFLENEIDKYAFSKVVGITPGGITGQDSIFNGLVALANYRKPTNEIVVLVHDGVRPLIDNETISQCIQSVRDYGSTATVSPSVETVIRVEEGEVVDVMERDSCKFARAPQGFNFADFFNTHLLAKKDNRHNFVDSISMMSFYGFPVHVIEGPDENIKITTPRDFFTFKAYQDMEEIKQVWE